MIPGKAHIHDEESMNEEWVYFFERKSDVSLVVESKGDNINEYVLEGPFAELGKLNNNNRIYEAEEYLSHLPELQEKIKNKTLLGEMDHPESFDVSLKNISHLIEGIEFDKKNNIIKGRIRLLDTTYGRQAKVLVDAGIPLHISSRAAGTVQENKKVKIKKIFTYDLVSTPGFANAMLKPIKENFDYHSLYSSINESLSKTDDPEIYTTHNMNRLGFMSDEKVYAINESLSSPKDFDSLIVYKLTDSQKEELFECIERDEFLYDTQKNNTSLNLKNEYIIKEKNTYSQMSDFLKREDFEAFTKNVQKQFDSIREELEVKNFDKRALEEKLSKLADYSKSIGDRLAVEVETAISEIENTKKYAKKVGDINESNLEEVKGYVQKTNEILQTQLNEKFENIGSWGDNISRHLQGGLNYLNEVAQLVDKTTEFTKHLQEGLENNFGYTFDIAQKVDQTIGYVHEVARYSDANIEMTKMLKENVQASANMNEYLKEKVEQGLNYMNSVLKEDLESNINTVNAIAESINENRGFRNTSNSLLEKGGFDYSKLDGTVNRILEDAGKNKASNHDKIIENLYPFVKILNEQQKSVFLNSCDDTKKQKVKELVVKHNVYYDAEKIAALCESVLKEVELPVWLSKMPEKYKPIWESLNENEKASLVAQAKFWNFTNDYQIESWWRAREFNSVKQIPLETVDKLNENQSVLDNDQNFIYQRGYSKAHLENVANALKNKNRFTTKK